MNRIIIIGNLGYDPEVNYIPNKLGLKHIDTQWFNCLAYGRLAENRKTHLTKGQQVRVESRLKSCTYTTKDGQTRSSLDVTVSDVHFLSDK